MAAQLGHPPPEQAAAPVALAGAPEPDLIKGLNTPPLTPAVADLQQVAFLAAVLCRRHHLRRAIARIYAGEMLAGAGGGR
jgi:hypothetical protein